MEVTVSGIFSRALAMVQERMGPLLGIWAAYMVAIVVVAMVLVVVIGGAAAAGFGSMGSGGNPLAALGVGVIAAIIVALLILLAVFCAQYVALTAMAAPGSRPTFGEAFAIGLKRIPTILGVALLLFLAYLVGAAAFAALFWGLGSASGPLAIILLIVIVPALIYVGSRLAVVFALIGVEGETSPVAAIARSWRLTEGHALPIFGAFFLLAVATLAVNALLELLPEALNGLLSLIVFAFTTILQAAMQSAIHASLTRGSSVDLSSTFE